MAELLDSDRAKPVDMKAAMILLAVCVTAVIAFSIFGKSAEMANDSGARTGESGLKLGVEEATSHPQLVLPR